jgi:hypothetical protein
VPSTTDALAGASDDFEQQAQVGGDEVVDALFLDEVAGEGDLGGHE